MELTATQAADRHADVTLILIVTWFLAPSGKVFEDDDVQTTCTMGDVRRSDRRPTRKTGNDHDDNAMATEFTADLT